MHRKRTRRILGDLKNSVSWELDSEREGSTFGARWDQTNLCVTGATRVGVGGRWKNQHRNIVPLSPNVENPLSSKEIKSFIHELRRRKCFSCFGIPMFYLYMLWTFYVRFTYPYSCMAMLLEDPVGILLWDAVFFSFSGFHLRTNIKRILHIYIYIYIYIPIIGWK